MKRNAAKDGSSGLSAAAVYELVRHDQIQTVIDARLRIRNTIAADSQKADGC